MTRKPFKIYTGVFTDSRGAAINMQLIEYENRVFIVVDDTDMTLQGNVSDLNVGMTEGAKQVIKLTNTINEDYELDVTNPGVPILMKVPK